MSEREGKIVLVSNWTPYQNRIKDMFVNDDNENMRIYYIPNGLRIFEKVEKTDPVEFKQQYFGEPWVAKDEE